MAAYTVDLSRSKTLNMYQIEKASDLTGNQDLSGLSNKSTRNFGTFLQGLDWQNQIGHDDPQSCLTEF